MSAPQSPAESPGDLSRSLGFGSPFAVVSLNELITRVLDLFSITSWLPATLVALDGSLLIYSLTSDRESSQGMGTAVPAIVASGGALAAFAGAAVLLATLLMQNVQMNAVRLCTGNWRNGHVLQRPFVAYHERRAARLHKRYTEVSERIWRSVLPAYCRYAANMDLDVLERRIMGKDIKAEPRSDAKTTALGTPWWFEAPSHLTTRRAALADKLADYPRDRPYRTTLPGNILASLQPELISHCGSIDADLLALSRTVGGELQHDYTAAVNRFEMHAAITVAFSLLTGLSVAALLWAWQTGHDVRPWSTAMPAVNAVITTISYAATTQTVRHYVGVARAVIRS